jgi:SAM-dependent methyltransferase
MTEPGQSHWENVYSTKSEREVSWFEDSPDLSLRLIDETGVGPSASVVDIGGGASRLVDALVGRGQSHVTVLDLSSAALDVARRRVGITPCVDWVASDVTTWMPGRLFDLWHDRAAFHFLVQEEDRRAYVETMRKALRPSAYAIIGTFAPDGPEKCSGLPIVRYDEVSLADVLGQEFKPLAHIRHTHLTPWGSEQRFQFTTFQRL